MMVINPMMFNNAYNSSATVTTSGTTEEIWYELDKDEFVEDQPEEVVDRVWPVAVWLAPCQPIKDKFIRRFRGTNRGRHWNRKRY